MIEGLVSSELDVPGIGCAVVVIKPSGAHFPARLAAFEVRHGIAALQLDGIDTDVPRLSTVLIKGNS